MLEYLRKVPWKIVKSTIDWVRRQRPTDWPEDAPTVAVDASHADIEAQLRDDHYEGTPYTLLYRGEVVNLRRPIGVRTSSNGFDYYSEDHVRTRDHPVDDELVEVCVHNEWSRYEEKTGHVHKRDIEWLDEGEIRALLASSGIDAARVEAR